MLIFRRHHQAGHTQSSMSFRCGMKFAAPMEVGQLEGIILAQPIAVVAERQVDAAAGEVGVCLPAFVEAIRARCRRIRANLAIKTDSWARDRTVTRATIVRVQVRQAARRRHAWKAEQSKACRSVSTSADRRGFES